MDSYIKLGVAALLPVITSVIFVLIDRKVMTSKPMEVGSRSALAISRQAVIGVVFGILAVIGTEWGIPINGAMVNSRDSAVLCAGLLFGAPAGIIAGVIGGVERWIAVAWGVGSFTRLACSISTLLAGFYAAFLRKAIFRGKRPSVILAFAVGVVMEVFHLTMVFMTNLADPTRAAEVVRICTVPMVTANALSVMLATFAVFLLDGRTRVRDSKLREVSQIIQTRLLLCVTVAFIVTIGLSYILQTNIAKNDVSETMELAIDDVASDISDASDANLLRITKYIARDLEPLIPESGTRARDWMTPVILSRDLRRIAGEYGVTEINVIQSDGYISASTLDSYLGFDMASGPQSSAFLVILDPSDERTEYVQKYGPISSDENVSMKYAAVVLSDGFVQVGYDAAAFQHDIDEQVISAASHRRTSESGFLFIAGDDGTIVSGPDGYAGTSLSGGAIGRAISEDLQPEGSLFEVPLGDTDCLCMYKNVEGYRIVAVTETIGAMRARNMALYLNTFFEILVFAVLFLLIYLLIESKVVGGIRSIGSSLEQITAGRLDTKADVRSSVELAALSDGINTTVDSLKDYVAKTEERMAEDLRMAKTIQASALPGVFPAYPHRSEFDIYASMTPAKDVGGDFYDFYLTHRDTFNFLVADVSGKGIPAAMFMMRAKTLLKNLTESDIPMSEVFARCNDGLCDGNDAGMFVTSWQGQIDLTTGTVQYVNAGHNPPLVCRKDGSFEYLRGRGGFILAGMEGIPYKAQTLQLEPGDTVFLYTDGVTEATSVSLELFGEDRLRDTLNAAVASPEFTDMKSLCTIVKREVDAFFDGAEQFDDITMLAFKYMPQVGNITRHELNVAPDPANVTAVTEFAENLFEEHGCSMKVIAQMNIAIDEIFSNIANYGGSGEDVQIRLDISKEPAFIKMSFMDSGVPFNPLLKADPDVDAALDDRPVGGLGIYMVKKSMDDVSYEYIDGKNILTITKSY